MLGLTTLNLPYAHFFLGTISCLGYTMTGHTILDGFQLHLINEVNHLVAHRDNIGSWEVTLALQGRIPHHGPCNDDCGLKPYNCSAVSIPVLLCQPFLRCSGQPMIFIGLSCHECPIREKCGGPQ